MESFGLVEIQLINQSFDDDGKNVFESFYVTNSPFISRISSTIST